MADTALEINLAKQISAFITANQSVATFETISRAGFTKPVINGGVLISTRQVREELRTRTYDAADQDRTNYVKASTFTTVKGDTERTTVIFPMAASKNNVEIAALVANNTSN